MPRCPGHLARSIPVLVAAGPLFAGCVDDGAAAGPSVASSSPAVDEPVIARYGRVEFQRAFLDEPLCEHVIQPFDIVSPSPSPSPSPTPTPTPSHVTDVGA